mgnify:CR=1 FL=1
MRKLFLIYWLCPLFWLIGCSDFLEPKSSDEYIPENATSLDEMLVEEVYTGLVANSFMFQVHNFFDDFGNMNKLKRMLFLPYILCNRICS